MAFQITFRGITGLVGFDQSGFRASVSLDLMTVDEQGLQKVILCFYDSFTQSMPLMCNSITNTYKNNKNKRSIIAIIGDN